MSIVGEMYEEQIWENEKKLKEKMEKYLADLQELAYILPTDRLGLTIAIEKFRETFSKELE
jgi:cytochrome c556